jgi:hypothetical protein
MHGMASSSGNALYTEVRAASLLYTFPCSAREPLAPAPTLWRICITQKHVDCGTSCLGKVLKAD